MNLFSLKCSLLVDYAVRPISALLEVSQLLACQRCPQVVGDDKGVLLLGQVRGLSFPDPGLDLRLHRLHGGQGDVDADRGQGAGAIRLEIQHLYKS